ncbi:hypothetical protein SLP22_0004 [Salmonella phage BAU.Micro_SLP-22]
MNRSAGADTLSTRFLKYFVRVPSSGLTAA